MFERYTERARRVLFFARYEASQLGSISIETEHLLLGLIREGKGLTGRIFGRSHISLENTRKEIEGRVVFHEKVNTSVEIPFSAETKRVLGYAAEEADRLLHNYIGTEHLLLGLLREQRCVAASILMEKGMRLHTVREDIVQLLNEKTTHDEDETETESAVRQFHGSAPRPFPVFVPNFLPSEAVHIAYSNYSPDQEAWVHAAGHVWRAFGHTLLQIVAHAWGSDVSRVKLAAPRDHDLNTRYDFMIVLPATTGTDAIPRLLREAIERELDVEVTREDGDPPTLIIRPR
jgi:hypothetical protein